VTKLNARGQIPIFSSINSWNETLSQNTCPQNEAQVTAQLADGRYVTGCIGHPCHYLCHYDRCLLFAIERAHSLASHLDLFVVRGLQNKPT
jgi:hypothetical protein